ncbi:hypothetical protein F0562_013346 [Nyssa sinensis]|uniref:Uncharacterized protein n=1 Tax=Nyssa sinensis TaxID=561372 RepID=A0A5J4ZK72_9ASTE|nr:hypothetical protein F0562_013346 [Nyssa sinensis]
MCSDAGELRCRCWCNSAAVRQGYGLELRMGVVVKGRVASRAVVVAAIAPVTAVRGSVVALGISPNLALFFGGKDKLPAFLAHHSILGFVVDPCAAILVFIVTGLLCIRIKESSLAQAIVTTVNIGAMIFVIIASGYLVTSTAEEVKNHQRDLPLGMGISLSICCILYMMVSDVIVGLVPYYTLDPDTPIPSAFASHRME